MPQLGSVTYTVAVASTIPSSLQAMSLNPLLLWDLWAALIFQEKVGGGGEVGVRVREGDSNCPAPAQGSTGGHAFSMTSSNIR